MIYELRIYAAIPGKLPALNERFAKITMGYFKKYGMKMVGFWTDEIGTTNCLTYILAFDDMAQRDKAWDGFRADPERAKAFAESEKDGPLVAHVTNTIMRPTAYSPLQ
ncbi:MAG: NIPSNAP family protein [Deltaproteobacteria bacterium]|nr:NIPSNAP family protein [Deltaproteobacteria bacterium]